ncbi:MAG: hypothetical protein ACREBW_06485 [Candidatus Micrarchaeaceae archaeon]
MPASSTDLQWLQVTDFRAGIYAAGRYTQPQSSGGPGPLPTPRSLAVIVVPQPGIAQESGTFGCIGLTNGGLAPLPATQPVASNPPTDPKASLKYPVQVVGFHAFGPVVGGAGSGYLDELHFALEWINTASFRKFNWSRYRLFDTKAYDQIISYTAAATTASNQFGGCSFDTTRMNTVSPYTAIGIPVVAMAWHDLDGTKYYWNTFPDPSTPTTLSTLNLESTYSGLMVSHQGRLVLAQDLSQSHGNSSSVSFNESLMWTAPNSNVIDSQNTGSVFAPEIPSGYGVMRTTNAGELLIVKHQGGAVLVSGDLDNASSNRLPSVVSTGNLVSRGANSTIGFAYLAYQQGLWIWGGGDASEKISSQLNDDFYFTSPPVIGISHCAEEWGDWIVTSNNWLYDTNLQSWWRLEDPTVNAFQWLSRGHNSDNMYAAPPQLPDPVNNTCAFYLHKATLRNSFSWQSHPLPATRNRLCEVREIILRAQGNGTVTITLTGLNANGPVATEPIIIPVDSSDPVRYRAIAFISAFDITFQMVSTSAGTGAAPTIYEIQFGHHERQLVNAT